MKERRKKFEEYLETVKQNETQEQEILLEQQKQVRFQQTHNQGLRQLLLTLSWDLCA